MINEELNKMEITLEKSLFAELSASEAYANAEGELSILIGKDENGAVVADLSELPHVFAYSTKCQDLSDVMNATVLSLLDKYSSSHLNFVMIDLNGVGLLSNYGRIPDSYFWNYPSRQNLVVDDQKSALHLLSYLVKEVEDRYELLRKSRTHNLKEYSEALADGRIALCSEYPAKPNLVILVSDFWRFVNESKAAEISLSRVTELGKAVGVHLVAATMEQPELINADILSAFPSRVIFKTDTPEDSQALLFASDAATLEANEIVFVKNKFFFGFKNTRKIMTEGSIDVDFEKKVTSAIDQGLMKVLVASPNASDVSRIIQKLQR